MRTALLSARLRNDSGDLRSSLRVGGRSVLRWQVDLAMALDCQRIVCLCDALNPDILLVQQEVEGLGGEFHAIQDSLQLVGLVVAGSDVVVLGDGLFVPRSVGIGLMGQGRGIAALPSSASLASAYPAVFERIDRENASAGLAVLPSSLVSKLADHPIDSEPASLLLRLGLQGGLPVKPISSDWIAEAQWVLVNDAENAAKIEQGLFAQTNMGLGWHVPGLTLANWLARMFARRGLAGSAPVVLALAILTLICGPVLTYLSYPLAALCSVLIGSFLTGFWARIQTQREVLFGLPSRSKNIRYLNYLRDIATIGSMTIGGTSVAAIALPVLGIGAIAAAGLTARPGIGAFWHDRTTHVLALFGAAIFGQLEWAVFIFGTGALASILLQSHRKWLIEPSETKE